jgi:membrane protein required for colicin V production
MNTLDLIVVAVILLSAAFAFARGFIREILSIAAWVGAAFATIYGYSYAVPAAESVGLPKPFSDAAAAAVVFIVALIFLSIITSVVARRVARTGLSSFDRLFGLIFGVARGAILVILGYIALDWAEKPAPDWVTQARTLSFLQEGAKTLKAWVPATFQERAKTTVEDARHDVDQASDAAGLLRAPPPLKSTKPDQSTNAITKKDQAEKNNKINQLQKQQ